MRTVEHGLGLRDAPLGLLHLLLGGSQGLLRAFHGGGVALCRGGSLIIDLARNFVLGNQIGIALEIGLGALIVGLGLLHLRLRHLHLTLRGGDTGLRWSAHRPRRKRVARWFRWR